MDSRGSQGGATDGPSREPTSGPDDADEADDGAAIDPLPSTGSLRWADDPPVRAPAPVGEAAPAPGDDPTIGEDPTTGIVTPAGDVWAPPTGPPFPAATPQSGGPSGSSGAPGPSGSGRAVRPPGPSGGAGPSGPSLPSDPSGPPDAGPRHAKRGPGGGRGGQQRRETVVLAAIGVAVVVVGVAAMTLGSDDGDPSLTAPSSTTTLVLAGDGTDPTGPIVGPSGIVGWWSGTEWVPRAEGEPPEGTLDLTVVGLGGPTGSARGVTEGEECASQRATAEFDLSVELPADDDGPPPVAVAGVPQPQPRPIERFDQASPVYQQAAIDVATGLGATTPPTATSVLITDLDGSGTNEAVLTSEHLGDPDEPAPGDWSVVFLRRVVGNDVATDVLGSSVGGSGERFERIRLSALADLNVDGTVELVLDGRSADGQWTAVHALGPDGVPAEVLREGCEG
jgi:hypothetical protein